MTVRSNPFPAHSLMPARVEFERSLDRTRQSIEQFADHDHPVEVLDLARRELRDLHAIAGLLQFPGLQLALAEMREALQAVIDADIDDAEAACSALLGGCVQLADYLEVVSQGREDCVLVLQPLINELRLAMGRPLVTESALFVAQMHAIGASLPFLPPPGTAMAPAYARKLLPLFQSALLSYVRRQPDAEIALKRMGRVAEQLAQSAQRPGVHTLWRTFAAVVEALLGQALEEAIELKRLMGNCGQQLKVLATAGEQAADTPARDLALQLLFFVGRSRGRGPRVQALRQAYRLADYLPAESQLEQIRARLHGPNMALLTRVAEELHRDFRDIEDAIDLMVRTRQYQANTETAARMRRLASTLSTLGQPSLARALGNQAAALEALPEDPSHWPWMELATALLRTEHSLEQALFRQLNATRGGTVGVELEERVPHSEDLRRGRVALLRESMVDLARFKSLFAALLNDSERQQRPEALRLLNEVRAALNVIGEARAATLMQPMLARLGDATLSDWVSQPMLAERFADATTALELYLEALRDELSDVVHRLDDFSGFVDRLEQEVETGLAGAPAASTVAVPEAVGGDAADEAGPDPEIREIFLEEAEQVSETLSTAVARWGRQPDTGDALVTIRRAFHTLKGSGRMAGASGIGEFGWAVENLLNHCLDGAIEISPSIIDLVERAQVLLPELIRCFREQRADPALLAPLIADAQHLAAGHELVEPETLTVFRVDANERLAEAQHWLRDGVTRPPPEAVVRAFHTLRGSAAVAGAPAVSEISAVLEHWLSVLRGEGRPLSPSAHALMLELMPYLAEGVASAGSTAAAEADGQPWLERLQGEVGTLPVATATPAEQELADVFAMEALTAVNRLEDQVQAWSQSPQRSTVREAIDKLLHTLAGAAVMARATAFSASVVALQKKLRDNVDDAVPTPAFFTRLLEVVEGFYQQLDAFRDGQLNPEEAGLLARIDALDPCASGRGPETLSDRAGTEPSERDAAAPPAEPDAVPSVGSAASFASDTLPVSAHEATPLTEADGPALTDEPMPVGVPADAVVVPETAVDNASLHQPPPTPTVADAAASVPEDGADPEEVPAPPAGEALDDELQDIFLSEARELLEALDAVVQRGSRDAASVEVQADAKRILHTLKGSARVAGMSALGDIAQALETQVIDQGGSGAPATLYVRLGEVTDQLHGVLDAIVEGDIPDTDAVLAVCDLGRRRAPEPVAASPALPTLVATEVADSELLDIFAAEAVELLEGIDAALNRWRSAPFDEAPRRDLQRALHTLKGGARMSGWRQMGDQAHALETRLEALDAQPGSAVDPGLLETVSGVVEQLHGQLDDLQQGRTPPSAVSLIDPPTPPTEAIIPMSPATGTEDDGVAANVEQADEGFPPQAEVPPPTDAAHAAPTQWDPLLFWRPDDEQSGLAALRRETARVPVERLDGMLNEVGEIAIYRSRLEEQVAGLGLQLSEMTQAIDRMREQLRQMGAETDAQISARGLAGPSPEQDRYAGDFDPLEMDRYTRMQELSRALNESVGDLGALHDSMAGLVSESESLLLQQGRISTDVQQNLMGTLMVPFARQIGRLERVVRTVAQETGKQVRLVVEGDDAELDRNVLDRMTAPLEHLLRNAVVHGIEATAQRVEAGKDPIGTVTIRLQRDGSQLLLNLADDGGGFDFSAIRETAIRRGLLRADAAVTEDDLQAFIFEPGFSTARQLTQEAGRGIGMDVVASEVKQLGGTLTVDGKSGEGARFQVRLPLTLAISQALMVNVAGELFALPLTSIEGIVRIGVEALDGHLREGGAPYLYGNQAYRVRCLADYLGLPRPSLKDARTVHAVLIRTPEGPGAAARHTAMVVDQLLGNREIVSKAVGALVSSVNGISSATILPDGRVVLILDAPALVQARARRARVAQALQTQESDQRPLVMVVDDSITIRRVTERLLGRNGYRVVTAKDGLDAMAQLQTVAPVAILLDIEMPRADGFEVASFVRNTGRIRNVPIIMITSRSGEKHRARAAEIGVDRYLIKPYQEEQLMSELQDVLGAPRP